LLYAHMFGIIHTRMFVAADGSISEAPGPVPVESAFARLLEQLRAGCALPVDDHSPERLARDMRCLREIADVAEFGCSRRLPVFERKGGPKAAGATSAVAWVRSECNLSGAAAAERVQVGRHLDELPLVAAAVQNGEIGFEHAAVLARTAAEVGVDAVSDAQEVLLAKARINDPGQLRVVARSFSHSVDPAGFLDNALRQREKRFVRLHERQDGMTVLEGLLDPEAGAMLQAALDPFMMPAPDDTRTAPQRRADAVREVARRVVHGDTGHRTGRRRPHVLVIATDATLRGEPGAPAAEMGRGAMVPTETAQRIACDASVTVVRLDANGRPTGPGRMHRTVTPGEWAALVARDRGCRWPGRKKCPAPLDWCDGHHLDSYVYTKKTEIATTVVLCERHHTMVHEEGWALAGDPAGELLAFPPSPGGRPRGAPEGVPAGVPGSRVWRQPAGAWRGGHRVSGARPAHQPQVRPITPESCSPGKPARYDDRHT
jgi:hypothetical protein